MSYQDITVLLIEDNPGDVRLIKAMLGDTEYATARFRSAATLAQSKEASHEAGSVAAVLLDLNLPDSDGIGTLRRVNKLFRDSAIIILTGMEDEEMAIEALRTGAQNYLIKDKIDPRRLARALRYAIERHGFMRRLREADRIISERDLRFRMLIEHGTDLTMLVDRSGRIIYASPSVRRLFGYSKDPNLDVFSLLHEEDVEPARSRFTLAQSQPRAPVPLTARARTMDGRYVALEGTINDLLELPGVQGIVVNMRDITQQLMYQQRIAFDRSNLHALINSTQDHIWSFDRENRLITGNIAFLDTIEQLTGKRPRPGDDMLVDVKGAAPASEWKAHFDRTLRGESFRVEEHITEPTERWIEINYGPIREGGDIVGVAGFSRDITERRLIEDRMRRNEATMAKAQAIAHFGTWELDLNNLDDPTTGPHGWSDEIYRIVGIEPGSLDVNLRTFFNLVHPDDKVLVRGTLDRTMAYGVPYSFDHRIVRPDGIVRWLHEEGAVVTGPGGSRRVLGTVLDITERKAAEESVQKMNAELERRVVDRTQELVLVNEELEHEVVRNRSLSKLLKLRNDDLLSSMNYARRIQNALFPTVIGARFFAGTACLSLPRDVVSGDFLWWNESPAQVFFALADCTGHGVPGALMSMLGSNLLAQAVRDQGITRPAAVLSMLDKALEDLFTQHRSEERIHDGMDMGFFTLDKKTLTLEFAGALLRCYVLRHDQLHQLDCSRFPIGGHVPHANKKFTQERFRLEKGDRIILSTDGYQSQFGGDSSHKLNARSFRELLRQSGPLGPQEAVGFLEKNFQDWRGSQDQVDDVLIAIMDI